ncbi:MAG: nickel pincer cofactor biosynthesis protein LarB [Deltaproteobacteria bacterium]|nr:nickel pincer cofactor biosynthesis protein LarB [Deltaproteobacteria bacterium]
MHKNEIEMLLHKLAQGAITVGEVLTRLGTWPIGDVEIAKLDLQRPLRNGFAEVVLAEGKTLAQLEAIFAAALRREQNLFATRMAPEVAAALQRRFALAYDPIARTATCGTRPVPSVAGQIAIVSAGTADQPVADEARSTAEFFGARPRCWYDVGVAGLHRLLGILPHLREAEVVIAVAGMEGALPSVVGGLVPAPIIAVPTSVGYGLHRHGETALFAMLNSCAEGVTVVNVDNGFGAACAALRVLRAKNAVRAAE